MSVAKLTKQLKRDLKANPKKAGMLGLLCLVCAYFWGPLVFPQEEPKKPTAKLPTTPAASAAMATVAAATDAASAGLMDWRELAQFLADESRRHAAIDPMTMPPTATRNPFAQIEEKMPAPKVEETKMPSAAKAVFESLNIVVTGTMVGGEVQRAMINGRGYSRGAIIGRLDEKDVALTNVRESGVTIEWNGIRRELKLPPRGPQKADAANQNGK